ncbi:hypothetical protein ACFYU9_35265 [Streptomyces sp. NPDC004327]|uniref:hypothetical protein n=1 Tax=Streptomyces sp. NPDC004327 TaxID=3364699 RepID=UPI0036AF1201
MHTTASLVLAGAFENIGNGLFSLGESWADKALKLFILGAVLITVVKKMSLKAGIGALLGLAICLGIYNARTELADAFKQEIVDLQSAPAHTTPHPSGDTARRIA